MWVPSPAFGERHTGVGSDVNGRGELRGWISYVLLNVIVYPPAPLGVPPFNWDLRKHTRVTRSCMAGSERRG